MSSYTQLEELAQTDELMADMYALVKFLDENITGPKAFYFSRPARGFTRPSLYIKFVSFSNRAINDYYSEMAIAAHVQYFTDDDLDALHVGHQLTKLLGGHGVGIKDVILPRYDFTMSPPEKMPVSGLDASGHYSRSAMGARVLPGSLNASPFQEQDGTWNVPVTFNIVSPRVADRCYTLLENITFTRIAPALPIPLQIVEVEVAGTPLVQATVS